jgi:hypothetical protein
MIFETMSERRENIWRMASFLPIHLARLLFAMLQNLYGSPPCFPLAGVDLAKIEHIYLRNTSAADSVMLNDALCRLSFE